MIQRYNIPLSVLSPCNTTQLQTYMMQYGMQTETCALSSNVIIMHGVLVLIDNEVSDTWLLSRSYKKH